MIELAYAAGGFVSGVWVMWRVHRRLCKRLTKHLFLENEARKLQNQRETIEFGPQDEPRPGAGEQAWEASLFSTRPGALMLTHLADKNAEKG